MFGNDMCGGDSVFVHRDWAERLRAPGPPESTPQITCVLDEVYCQRSCSDSQIF